MQTSQDHSSDSASPKSTAGRSTHWLYRCENLPRLWIILLLVLLLVLLPEFFVERHAHVEGADFVLDASFGFFAWYGFAACAGMVAAAKVLGIFLKRKDSYYDE